MELSKKISKKLFLRLLYIIEILLFLYCYFFGPQGIQKLREIKNATQTVLLKIETAQNNITALETTIVSWETNNFYKEKMAREQLQMAKETDEVYYFI